MTGLGGGHLRLTASTFGLNPFECFFCFFCFSVLLLEKKQNCSRRLTSRTRCFSLTNTSLQTNLLPNRHWTPINLDLRSKPDNSRGPLERYPVFSHIDETPYELAFHTRHQYHRYIVTDATHCSITMTCIILKSPFPLQHGLAQLKIWNATSTRDGWRRSS